MGILQIRIPKWVAMPSSSYSLWGCKRVRCYVTAKQQQTSQIETKKRTKQDFPGVPVVKTPCSQHGLDLCLKTFKRTESFTKSYQRRIFFPNLEPRPGQKKISSQSLFTRWIFLIHSFTESSPSRYFFFLPRDLSSKSPHHINTFCLP